MATKANIAVTPGGVWKFNPLTDKKEAIQPNRENKTWLEYPDDNMGVMFIKPEHNLLVFYIDGEPFTENPDTQQITVPSLNITLPKTLMTTTSKDSNRHLYFLTDTTNIPNRLVKLKNTAVDIFTYGKLFDLHKYSTNHGCNYEDIVAAPDELIDLIIDNMPDKSNLVPSDVVVKSNPKRARLAKAFAANELTTNKAMNAFFRSVMPSEYVPKNSKKITFKHFEDAPFYDLINKTAVKLTTTAELNTQDEALPVLYRIIEAMGRDASSSKTQSILNKQILASLPSHEAEFPYTLEDDDKSLEEHTAKQHNTTTPVFKVIVNERVRFIQINKYSFEPIKHNSTWLFDAMAARSLNPERQIVNEAGQVVGWDDNVPIIYLTDSPYEPQHYYDAEMSRHVINLYRQTQYIKEVEPREKEPNNYLTRFMRSTIPPDYYDLVQHYYAHTIFGKRAPTMVLWMASMGSDLGGTGKSIITIDLLSKVLGSGAVVVSKDDMTGNWGDTLVGARVVSLEDLQKMSSREFNDLYAAIKQATSSALKRLNMKGVAFRTERLNITITGSSNDRLSLQQSDRRFLCLEPAHLRGLTEALSPEDALTVERFRQGDEYSDELQQMVNYWYYLYQQPLTTEMEAALTISPPQTPFRRKWVLNAKTNSSNVIPLLQTPMDLLSAMKYDEMEKGLVVELLSLPIATYNPTTGKTAFPWNWFLELLYFIMSDKHNEERKSKTDIQNMLGIEFTTNVGALYFNKWDRKWKQSGYVMNCDDAIIADWQRAINEVNDVR